MAVADCAVGLAKATGLSENLLLTLLTALKSLGLIVEHDGQFANAPATAKFLVAGAPGDFRDYVRLVNGAFGYESFRHLTSALRGERQLPAAVPLHLVFPLLHSVDLVHHPAVPDDRPRLPRDGSRQRAGVDRAAAIRAGAAHRLDCIREKKEGNEDKLRSM